MKAHAMMVIRWIQLRREFKFLSSVKLAVPLMLIVAAAVAWGTVVESKYNAEMAKIVVYNSGWFSVLMTLLWVNIFCATLSRLPFKKHHVGFVITHLGLLILLAGGVVTSQFGIDGSLAVSEGDSDSMVSLPRLVFGMAPEGSMNFQTVEIERTLSPTESFNSHNRVVGHIAQIKKYVPFATLNSTFVSGPDSSDTAISFKLKSPFFDVAEFLHSRLSPRKQMGPATFELILGAPEQQLPPQTRKKPVPPPSPNREMLRVVGAQKGETLIEVSMDRLQREKKLNFRDTVIELQQVYRSATVSNGKLAESGDPKPNPALELKVSTGDKTYREVVFARFPNFSMSREPSSEFKIQYIAEGISEGSDGATETREPSVSAHDSGSTPTARFYLDPKNPDSKPVLELLKNNERLFFESINEGQTVETPWMGMKITLASVIRNAVAVNEVSPIEPKQREDIPSGALEIVPRGQSESTWVAEGETKEIQVDGRKYTVYFGRKMLRLPFRVNLKKFTKRDYPGTQTAMSFESDVTINSETKTHKISMNEPLVQQGYTLYQASYQLNPGAPAISVFSVNHDPARTAKYLGSLVLCLGIVVFVIQRSSLYRQWQKRKDA